MNNSTKQCDETIEDIVDDRKEKGQYNISFTNDGKAPCRYAYSAPVRLAEDKSTCLDVCSWNIEGEMTDGRDSTVNNIGPTDSEITVLRVKMDNSYMKTAPENNWNMKDEAIPGDGTHLGESPSLVNLATLVVHSKDCYEEAANCTFEGREYLVPLSSWDPTDKRQNSNDVELQSDTVQFETLLNENEDSSITILTQPIENNDEEKSCDFDQVKSQQKIGVRHSLSNKFTNFIRKHLSSSKKKEYSKTDLQHCNSFSSVTRDLDSSNNVNQSRNE